MNTASSAVVDQWELDILGIDAIVADLSGVTGVSARAKCENLLASQRGRGPRQSKDDRKRVFDSGGTDNEFSLLRNGAELDGELWMDMPESGRYPSNTLSRSAS
jgi:hypothetical protein